MMEVLTISLCHKVCLFFLFLFFMHITDQYNSFLFFLVISI